MKAIARRGANERTMAPEREKTARQPALVSTADASAFEATPPSCCDVCHSPTAEARTEAGKRSATKRTSNGLTDAAKKPQPPHSALIMGTVDA
eukprot:5089830-Pleurochrysis_carterae.AAC.6